MGGNGKTFKVHKNLLCDKVPVFAAMFKGNFQEASTGLAKLPEDDEKAFEYFIGWLYRGALDPTTDCGHLLNLYGFAKKYELLSLMDLTINTMIKYLVAANILLTGFDVDHIYRITHEKSKLRLFGLRCYTYATVDLRDEGCWETNHMLPQGPNKVEIMTEKSKLRLFGLRCYTYATVDLRDEGCWETNHMLPQGPNKVEIMTDVFRQLRDLKNSTSRNPDLGVGLLVDPRTVPPCQYHVHAKGDPCPSSKN